MRTTINLPDDETKWDRIRDLALRDYLRDDVAPLIVRNPL